MKQAKPNPENEPTADALCRQGHEALAGGNTQEAARCYRQALRLDDEHAAAQLGLMRALRMAGKTDQAIAVGLRLTVLAPLHAEGHRELAACFEQAGQRLQAENARRRARVVEWKQQLATDSADEAGK